MLVETLLEAKTPQSEIATRAKCSVAQIKKMAKNKRGFGTVVRPKLVKQGRPRTFTQEMVEVRFNSTCLKAQIVTLEFCSQ